MVFLIGSYARYNWPYVWVRTLTAPRLPFAPPERSRRLTPPCHPPSLRFPPRPGPGPGHVQLRSYQGILSASDKDLPLDLKSTQSWNKGNGKRVWHIVEELVSLNVLPLPVSPFEVDFKQLGDLPPLERFCMTGALAAFLRELLQQKSAYTELGALAVPRAAQWMRLLETAENSVGLSSRLARATPSCPP